jgi:Trk-type K+ transport system membrane component
MGAAAGGGRRRSGALSVRGDALGPARVILLAYLAAIVVGGALLSLPAATEGSESVGPLDAVFTSASAVCVTGLTVVPTADTWSPFGLAVVAVLIQLGGLGILTFAALLMLTIRRRSGRAAEAAIAESQAIRRSDWRDSVKVALLLSVIAEALTAVALAAVLIADGASFGSAARSGVFHAISGFNNAGFSVWGTPVGAAPGGVATAVVLSLALIAGGLGVPVWRRLVDRLRGRGRLGLHATLTLVGTAVLLVAGGVLVLALEGLGADSLAAYSEPWQRIIGAFAHSASARTAGFDMVETDALTPESLLVTEILMFIGAGVGGTAGGVKVTTAAVLVLAMWSELRGRLAVQAFGREIALEIVRRALTIAFLGSALVLAAALGLEATGPITLEQATFEVVSAFGTVGLTTGITPELDAYGKVLLMALMILGRLGPVTLAATLALRERPQAYRYPEGEVLVG